MMTNFYTSKIGSWLVFSMILVISKKKLITPWNFSPLLVTLFFVLVTPLNRVFLFELLKICRYSFSGIIHWWSKRIHTPKKLNRISLDWMFDRNSLKGGKIQNKIHAKEVKKWGSEEKKKILQSELHYRAEAWDETLKHADFASECLSRFTPRTKNSLQGRRIRRYLLSIPLL